MLNPGTLCSLLFIQSLLTNTWARDPLNSAPSSRRKALLSRFAETPKESTIFITQCASSGIWTGRELTSRPEPLSLLPPSANPLQVQAPRTTHKGQSGAQCKLHPLWALCSRGANPSPPGLMKHLGSWFVQSPGMSSQNSQRKSGPEDQGSSRGLGRSTRQPLSRDARCRMPPSKSYTVRSVCSKRTRGREMKALGLCRGSTCGMWKSLNLLCLPGSHV